MNERRTAGHHRQAALQLGLVLALGACAGHRPPLAATSGVADAPVTAAPPLVIDSGIIDRRADPCIDFYQYACGGWLASTPIPPDRAAWSRSFSSIDERNLARLHDILNAYAADPPAGDVDARKLGDFYATCMDEAKAQSASAETLAERMQALAVVSGWPSLASSERRSSFARLVAALQLAGANVLFDFGSQQDFGDARQVIGAADQGGLGLPDRDDYLDTDARSVGIREAYRAHVARMFELEGTPTAAALTRARVVLAIETELARASMSRTERRDPTNVHHRLDRAGLERLVPDFDWSAYFERLGHPQIRDVNVMVPEFFRELATTLSTRRPGDLESDLAWRLLSAAAPALGPAFVEESFRFRSRNLTGETQLLPRWKRCLAAVDRGMGQALGQPFVAATLGTEGKAQAEGLVTDIEGAFQTTLEGLSWMDAPTREQALQKLALVHNQIGYPPRWRNYDALPIDRQSDLANRMNAAAFEMERDLGKIGKPVDRTDWDVPPQTVNAYYDPSKNEMVFPAGILQTPFFGPLGPPELNDGGIGVIMGHELTHGFDDEGRKFDGHGNLRDWWTPTAARTFEERVACVVSQFDAYPIAAGLHVNGRLTAGENIADQGGLRLAYDVFHAQVAGSDAGAQGASAVDRQFFTAFAQAWCTKRQEPYARMLAAVDPHAPPRYRVNGSASSLEAFQRAFACPTGAPMAPAKRCRVW